jgi:hypothetical protein
MNPRVFAFLLVCAAGFILVSSQQLPPIVASHFGASGVANGFMPFLPYVGLMLVLLVGLPALTVIIGAWSLNRPGARINIPNREYWLAPERRAQTVQAVRADLMGFGAFLELFLCYTHWLVVVANGRQPPMLPNTWFMAGLVGLLVVVGVWMIRFLHRFRRPD